MCHFNLFLRAWLPNSLNQSNSVDISLSVTASGTNTTGEIYSLECSATVTGSTDQPTITWLDPMNNPVPSEMVTTTGSMSTLTFNLLAASHAGTYTCRAMVGGAVQSETIDIAVQSECEQHSHNLIMVYFASKHLKLALLILVLIKHACY